MTHRLVAAAVLTLAACGPDLAKPSGFIEAYNAQVCQIAHACRSSYIDGDHTFSFELVYGESEDSCYAGVFVDPAALEASVGAGRIDYSSADAEACLAVLAEMPCEVVFDQEYDRLPAIGSCATTLVPKLDDGEVCATDFDCKGSDGYCDEGVCSNNK